LVCCGGGDLDKNIVLIGMPGCGKTTVGKLLAEKLETEFVDVDEFIEKKVGKTISEIFENGEEYFRRLEEQAVSELSVKKSIVISTGGGVIKNYSNIELLHKNGVIIFIDRAIEKIDEAIEIGNRPLLKSSSSNLKQLFEERYSLYTRYADYLVKNDIGIEEVITNIIKLIR
jgi:shikimate kinase